MATSDDRQRNWATIVYPDSAPDGWMQEIGNLHIPALISPKHDGDVNPITGELKKAHWHVLLKYAGKKSEAQVKADVGKFGGVGLESVSDFQAYARYLCHLDERDDSGKKKYNTGEVQSFGGIDYFDIITTAKDRTAILSEMHDWCIENDVTLFYELCRYADAERKDWARVLATTQGTNHMVSWLKSFEYGKRIG